jgi:hypothetical protein
MKKLRPEQRRRHLRILEKREKERKRRNQKRRRRKYLPLLESLPDLSKRNLQYVGTSSFIDKPHRHPLPTHRYHILVPKIFSLINNPDETLETLENVRHAAKDSRIKALTLDHSQCEDIELGASTVMDVLIMGARPRWNNGVLLGGAYPKKDSVTEILKVSGIIKHIGHPDSQLPESIRNKFKIFDLRIGKKQNDLSPFESSFAEIVTSDLTIYFDELLKTKDYSLSEDGKNNLSNLVSEVIDNAEQHSCTNNWFVVGHMSQITDEIGNCKIAIFDFGESIYNSLYSADLNQDTRDRIDSLISKHTQKGFFNRREVWTKENLYTMFALQEGVSRFNTKGNITDRGHGTVNMIEFFLELGKSSNPQYPSKMALISGKTYILFDGKYKLQYVDVGDERRQLIAFNENNSLEEKPDEFYVRNLKNRFSGTMITMDFYLDKEYLDNLKRSEVAHGKTIN